MSLKARLRIAIVALVTFVVIAMSVLYLYDFTRMTFRAASERANLIVDQAKGNLVELLARETAARDVHPASLEEWKENWTNIIRTDPKVEEMLKRSLASSDLVLAVLITDENGKVLASSNSDRNATEPPSEDFLDLQKGNWVTNFRDLMSRREEYSSTRSIGIGAEPNQQVLFKLKVLVQSVLLKNDVTPALKILGLAFGSSLFIGIFLGSVLPNLVLDPLERVSRSIDLIRSGEFDTAAMPPQRESREFADVQSKLNLLGEQYRGAKQDARELRSNVDQLLQQLEEAVLLFDNAGRLIMAGEATERMLGRTPEQMIGHSMEELFPASTVIGDVVGKAVLKHQSVHDQPVSILRNDSANVRLVVSVQVLRKDAGEAMGTLITLRDVESRRQLELQLDVSTRLAAISRLTGGVAHEIKNPLNAMALHLEVLKSKMEGQQPELDVIGREIKRLDNVVKTFLNFNRPVEVQAVPINVHQLLEQVIALVSVDAKTKNVAIEAPGQHNLWINGDPDLLKQAILNIVNNGLEAMPTGGKLALRTYWDGRECHIDITDNGSGIAPEVRDRIFHLYFTTKDNGSGIGLATTFRVVQLHSGTIDFVSEQGQGTTFRLRFPGMISTGEARTSASSGS